MFIVKDTTLNVCIQFDTKYNALLAFDRITDIQRHNAEMYRYHPTTGELEKLQYIEHHTNGFGRLLADVKDNWENTDG